MKTMKNKNLISTNCEETMKRKFSGVSLDILKRAENKGKCTPQLRAFAITLQFYSKKAYDYVRKTFNLALPHPRVLRTWYSKAGQIRVLIFRFMEQT